MFRGESLNGISLSLLLLKAVADCDEFASEHEDHVHFVSDDDSVAWCMMVCYS